MFEILMKSEMGDELEWVGVADEDAQQIWALLGFPQRVDLKSTPVRHGGIDAIE